MIGIGAEYFWIMATVRFIAVGPFGRAVSGIVTNLMIEGSLEAMTDLFRLWNPIRHCAPAESTGPHLGPVGYWPGLPARYVGLVGGGRALFLHRACVLVKARGFAASAGWVKNDLDREFYEGSFALRSARGDAGKRWPGRLGYFAASRTMDPRAIVGHCHSAGGIGGALSCFAARPREGDWITLASIPPTCGADVSR